MLSEIFYLVRSQRDGKYLVAHPQVSGDLEGQANPEYLLVFREYADALSYLNTHGAATADKFGIESLPSTQLRSLLKRWGFTGIGLVEDCLLPRIAFLTQQ
jgi:hypothetical protein